MTMRAPDTDLPIELVDVSFLVRERALNQNITLKLGAGRPTVLIGPNGAGKTTFLKLTMGLLQPTSGRITWGGRADAAPVRRSFMFQRPVMLRRSVSANIHYALASANLGAADKTARTRELLALVGLSGFEDRPARRLSGGEQQRLALARALARDPEVLFLDEPTASLDPAATKAIEDIIRTVAARGIKVVMSTHDIPGAKRLAGEIVLMHRGRIVETGPADEFFSNPKTQDARRFVAGELLV
jgi:tungstate transport system ATP-binding protein